MAIPKLGRQQTKEQVLESICQKLNRIENQQALEILDKLLDKPGLADKLVKNRFKLKNFL